VSKSTHPSSNPSALRVDSLADSVVVLLTLTIVQRLIGFVRGVLLCRWLEPDELGRWDMAFSFLMLAAPLAVLGLPGSFGRYAEHFRQRGQLRLFVRRTTLASIALAGAAIGGAWLVRDQLSLLVFGSADHGSLVATLLVALAAVITYNFLTELVTSLRMARLSSWLQFVNSLLFASVAVGLMLVGRLDAGAVVIAYGVASLLSSLAVLYWLRDAGRDVAETNDTPPPQSFWSKLAPFAAWVWLTNLIWNLFQIVDRYMIVHFSDMSPGEAIVQVGHYHSSRVVPLLMVAVAGMIGRVMLPHLSHDWENGRRGRVSERLNLSIKLLALAMFAGSVAVLFAAPLLFDWVFAGKYSGGLAVLPWTLTYCIWMGIGTVAHGYLWCAEKARLGCVAMGVGLIGNVALNLLLLPPLGLLGAVLATTVANAISLALLLLISVRFGMRLHRATVVLLMMPLVLGFGPLVAAAMLLAVMLEAITRERLFNRSEKQLLVEVWNGYAEKIRRRRRRKEASA
jgi:O-antigen/teichoic acid export membrane protein